MEFLVSFVCWSTVFLLFWTAYLIVNPGFLWYANAFFSLIMCTQDRYIWGVKSEYKGISATACLFFPSSFDYTYSFFDSFFLCLSLPQLLSLCSRACKPQLLSSRATTTEACMPRARVPQQEEPRQWEAPAPQWRVALAHHN